MAGSDTTVTALRSTLLFVITNPLVYRHLQQELDEAFSLTGQQQQQVLKDCDLIKLPYLQACIKESLRMIPPAHAPLPKIAPPEGDIIANQTIPRGTRVGTCVYGILRSKNIFGQDAEVYRPERWLGANGPELTRMNQAGDVIFGSGKYQCLGKAIAMYELRKSISAVSTHGSLD